MPEEIIFYFVILFFLLFLKTESRYKDKLIAESCLHLHKILGNVVFQSIGCRLFVESHTFGNYFALNILSIINFNPIQTFHQPLRTRGCNNINSVIPYIEVVAYSRIITMHIYVFSIFNFTILLQVIFLSKHKFLQL